MRGVIKHLAERGDVYRSTRGAREITRWSAACTEKANSGVMLPGKGRPVLSLAFALWHSGSATLLQWDAGHSSWASLLGAAARAGTLRDEVPADACFVGCLCVSLPPEGFHPGLDKICS